MAWPLPSDLQTRLEDATDPTGVPASVFVALVLVVLLLAGFGMAIQWSVSDLGVTHVTSAQS